MLVLAEYVPATMLDPKALGTAFDIHWQLVLGGAARTPRPDPRGAKGPSGVPHTNLHLSMLGFNSYKHVPVSFFDPQAIGTAFHIHYQIIQNRYVGHPDLKPET